MLVLTRKSTESVMIGDDVEVTVLAVAGDKVRIGISAPRDVAVFRREVYLDIQEARQQVTALPVAVAEPVRPALAATG